MHHFDVNNKAKDREALIKKLNSLFTLFGLGEEEEARGLLGY